MIFVTGANGCIGNVLTRILAENGREVLALAWDEGDRARIPNRPDVRVEYGDIRDRNRMEGIFARYPIDVVVHLAALVHRPDGGAEAFLEYNLRATEGLYEAGRRAGVRRFVFMSSTAVYGEETRRPAGEETPPAPASPYAVSKWRAEQVLLRRDHPETAYTIIRAATVYGRYDRGNVGRLVSLARKGFIPLPGRGDNVKSLVYVENLARGIFLAIGNPAAENGIFNLSDGEGYPMRELIGSIGKALGRSVRIIRLPRVPALLAARWRFLDAWRKIGNENRIDSSKAVRLLGYSPLRTLEEGLRSSYVDPAEGRDRAL